MMDDDGDDGAAVDDDDDDDDDDDNNNNNNNNNNKSLIDNSFVSSFQKKNKFCSLKKHFAQSEYNSKSKYRLL
jgi:hypothetical protein